MKIIYDKDSRRFSIGSWFKKNIPEQYINAAETDRSNQVQNHLIHQQVMNTPKPENNKPTKVGSTMNR